ncbi:uncharacterized protein LOC142572725 isoform X1 [Dermacentor variabilis]|uniref:uncharacterized protein LOC142572725 isoform X1 n=1 Tax=Dermacentor variabilis TaxID=34621 RepID=UPI003F5B7511
MEKPKHNRKLKRRLAMRQTQIAAHAEELCRSNWDQVCNSIPGNLSTKNAWQLLRHLVDLTHSRTASKHHITRLIHNSTLSPDTLLDELRTEHTEPGTSPHLSPYTGAPNEALDTDILEQEVRMALQNIRTSSALGKDRIKNSLVRNLDDQSITLIAEYFNQCWREGTLPQSWRHAKIIFIAKHNKLYTISNLRPISLTSRLGKLLKHVALNRLNQHMHDHNLYPHSMVGFRPGLSAQDAMLQLMHDIFDPLIPAHTKAILALYLSKAFDCVEHQAIMAALSPLNVGARMYAYIQVFLSQRTAEVLMGYHASPSYTLSGVGTPQGSVLSPFVFNSTIIPLAHALHNIPHLYHTLYADDITLWTTHGIDGDIEETLQTAANITQQHAQSIGLSCFPEKSQILLMRPSPRTLPTAPITITLAGHPIPEVDTLQILSLRIQSNGWNTFTLRKLKQVTEALWHLIRRVTGKHYGTKERDLCHLIRSFILSHFPYTIPYLRLRQEEIATLVATLHKAYKVALHFPPNMQTTKLLQLGLHNTTHELIETHRQAQYTRVAQSITERYILDTLRILIPAADPTLLPVPRPIHTQFIIKPLLRNTHATYHSARRKASAKALHKYYGFEADAVWVDAACTGGGAAAVVVDNTLQPIGASTPESSEEAAIALALTHTDARYVLTESKTALLNFERGQVHKTAFCILSLPFANPPRHVELLFLFF